MSNGDGTIAGFTPVPHVGENQQGVSHLLAASSPNCPSCDAPPSEHEVRNHDLAMHDGDVYCTKCGAYVRLYDAG